MKRITIANFTILSAIGDTVLFQTPRFATDDALAGSWNGFRPDGSAYRGLFKYRMEASTGMAQPVWIEGTACRIVCGTDAAVLKSKEGCYYITQVNHGGILDPKSPPYDEGCFK
jgi:hypothetical protein